MSLPLDALARRSVVIVGFGVEGRDVYRFLRGRFPEKPLAIAEQRPLDAEGQAVIAGDPRVRLHVGADHLDHVSEYEIAFRSPGIPRGRPALRRAEARGTQLTSQTALFLALCAQRVIGITGTKGKSTTSALIHAIVGLGIDHHVPRQ